MTPDFSDIDALLGRLDPHLELPVPGLGEDEAELLSRHASVIRRLHQRMENVTHRRWAMAIGQTLEGLFEQHAELWSIRMETSTDEDERVVFLDQLEDDDGQPLSPCCLKKGGKRTSQATQKAVLEVLMTLFDEQYGDEYFYTLFEDSPTLTRTTLHSFLQDAYDQHFGDGQWQTDRASLERAALGQSIPRNDRQKPTPPRL
jgi:hypothetical protein